MLLVEGWNFVKSIFGRKERRFLLIVLTIQTLTWSVQYCEESFPIVKYNFYFAFIYLTEFLSAVVMIIYLFVRRADKRSHKAVENLRKFQLFRFVYIMIVFLFYLVTIIISILVRIHIWSSNLHFN